MTDPTSPVPSSAYAPFPTPINVSKVRDEKGVKKIIKDLLHHYGWFAWMPGANGYGQQGVADHLALKNGVFLAVEAKFDNNKPKPMQTAFAGHILANDGYAFCVNQDNIDHLAWFLDSFEHSVAAQAAGRPLPDDHGARMVNAISVLTELFK